MTNNNNDINANGLETKGTNIPDLSYKLDKVSQKMAEIQEEVETIEFTPSELNLDPMVSLSGGFGVIGKAGTSQSELAYYSDLYMNGARSKAGWDKKADNSIGQFCGGGWGNTHGRQR